MLAKFNGRLSKEAFLLHHILGYLKELCDDCRSNHFSLMQQVKKGNY